MEEGSPNYDLTGFVTQQAASWNEFLQKYSLWITVISVIIIIILAYYLYSCMSEGFTTPSPAHQDTDDGYHTGDRGRSYFHASGMGAGIKHYDIADLDCANRVYGTDDPWSWMKTVAYSNLTKANPSPDAPDQQSMFDIQGAMSGHNKKGSAAPANMYNLDNVGKEGMCVGGGMGGAEGTLNEYDDPAVAHNLIGHIGHSDLAAHLHGSTPQYEAHACTLRAMGQQPAL